MERYRQGMHRVKYLEIDYLAEVISGLLSADEIPEKKMLVVFLHKLITKRLLCQLAHFVLLA